MRSLDIAVTGMRAQQSNVDVISQNLANLSTTGYKRMRPEFGDLLYQTIRRAGSISSTIGSLVPTGIQMGLGVKTVSVYRNHTQGTIQQTGNPLDIAIDGKGFFQVQLPDGSIGYTRNGTFQRSANGEVVTADGYLLQPTITVPENATDLTISNSGEVSVKIAGDPTPQTLQPVQLATFINDAGLEAIGNNLYIETAASGTPTVGTPTENGIGSILQSALEISNVDPVEEITKLITAQRAYELNSRSITASDEMLQRIVQV